MLWHLLYKWPTFIVGVIFHLKCMLSVTGQCACFLVSQTLRSSRNSNSQNHQSHALLEMTKISSSLLWLIHNFIMYMHQCTPYTAFVPLQLGSIRFGFMCVLFLGFLSFWLVVLAQFYFVAFFFLTLLFLFNYLLFLILPFSLMSSPNLL